MNCPKSVMLNHSFSQISLFIVSLVTLCSAVLTERLNYPNCKSKPHLTHFDDVNTLPKQALLSLLRGFAV